LRNTIKYDKVFTKRTPSIIEKDSDMKLLIALFTSLCLVLLILDVYIGYRKVVSPARSLARYRANTLFIASAALGAVTSLATGYLLAIKSDYVWAGAYTVNFFFYLYELNRRVAHGDDDWFNDQWKRAKRGWKSIRAALRSRTSPAYA
jgi:hypothetical protein